MDEDTPPESKEDLMNTLIRRLGNRTIAAEEVDGIRSKLGMSMPGEGILTVSRTILSRRPCRTLVFGLGNDSILWDALNTGRTVFLEDCPNWYSGVIQTYPAIEAYLINYGTERKEWAWFLKHEWALSLDLPPEIRNTSWDIIIVDGPQAYNSESPGRMRSIFASTTLYAPQADVFVDDCDREVESAFVERYIAREKGVVQANSSERFKHFQFDGNQLRIPLNCLSAPFFGERHIFERVQSLIRLFAVNSLMESGDTFEKWIQVLLDHLRTENPGLIKMHLGPEPGELGSENKNRSDPQAVLVFSKAEELDDVVDKFLNNGLPHTPIFLIYCESSRSTIETIRSHRGIHQLYHRCHGYGLSTSFKSDGAAALVFILPNGIR